MSHWDFYRIIAVCYRHIRKTVAFGSENNDKLLFRHKSVIIYTYRIVVQGKSGCLKSNIMQVRHAFFRPFYRLINVCPRYLEHRSHAHADGWPEPSMGWLRAQGFRTVAMALRDDSVPLNDPRLLAEERLAIVLGTEGDGLAQATIDACDYTVRIPMSHGVDSLNVAAASAVAFYQLGLQ